MKKSFRIKKGLEVKMNTTLYFLNITDISIKPSTDSGTGNGNSNQTPIRNK